MSRKRSLTALFVVLCVLLATAALFYFQLLSWETLGTHEDDLRRLIAEHPWRSACIGFLVYTAMCFVPGTTGKSLIVGWLFGFWSALVQVNVGLTIAALATFWLSRYLFRDAVRARLGPKLVDLDRALLRDGAYYLFAIRVVHGPYTITNYAMGVTSMRWRDFWLASQLGMLPANAIFVYAGAQMPSLAQLLEEGLSSVFSPRVIVALAIFGLTPLIVRLVRRQYFQGPDLRKPATTQQQSDTQPG